MSLYPERKWSSSNQSVRRTRVTLENSMEHAKSRTIFIGHSYVGWNHHLYVRYKCKHKTHFSTVSRRSHRKSGLQKCIVLLSSIYCLTLSEFLWFFSELPSIIIHNGLYVFQSDTEICYHDKIFVLFWVSSTQTRHSFGRMLCHENVARKQFSLSMSKNWNGFT